MAYDPRTSHEEGAAARQGPAARQGAASPARRGPHLGPVAITPARVFLSLALLGSMAYVFYAITVRDPSQIPALAVGAALLGIVFVALALAGVAETIRAGRDGRAARSVIAAVFGGLAGIVAFGCFAAAVLLMYLTQVPQAS